MQGAFAPEDQNVKSTPSIRILAICGILLSSFWAASASGATGTFDESLSVDGPLYLDVSTGSGSIDITPGSGQRVEITGKVKVGENSIFGIFARNSEESQELLEQILEEPPISLEDGHLKVGHLKGDAARNVSISYEIVVPAGTEVKSITGSGSMTITGVAGPVEAKTGSGSITLTDIGAAVKARSGSGTIKANEIAGAFEAHSGSGSIRLTQVAPGDVVATAGSGSIKLHGVEGSLKAKAGSGRVEIDGRQDGKWTVDTGSGSVKINLPDDAAFELDAHTGSGGINVDHPVTVQGKISKRRMRGEVRGGGDMLAVETGSGGIRIE
jgi:DUF4097 and DUF4098 domain-containing protein YvlB